MGRVKSCLLLCALLALQGCCNCPKIGRGKISHECSHHIEQPFTVSGPMTGVGLVLATADFGSGGAVVLKIQVEDLLTVNGTQADITVWSGSGEHPTTGTVPPAGGTQVYSTGGNTNLRFFTTHLDRTYDPGPNKYWLIVRVNHNTGGAPDNRSMWFQWEPSSTADPDTPHDFYQY